MSIYNISKYIGALSNPSFTPDTCMVFVFIDFATLYIQNELVSIYPHASKIHSIKHAQPEPLRGGHPHGHVSAGHSLRRCHLSGKRRCLWAVFPYCLVIQSTDVL